ncbi:MAG TPA: hypothetical protein VNG89_28005 [Vicinamibacterales bacterium]|nr:hypothetical protein [Vicinamibacterales bacterium]
MDLRVEVAERLHFEVRHQFLRTFDAVENRRDDHHRPGRFRNPAQIKPRQATRRDEAAQQPLEDLNDDLTHRNDGQEGNQRRPRPGPSGCVRICHGQRDQRQRGDGDRSEVAQRGALEERAPESDQDARLPANSSFELLSPVADQVVTNVSFTRVWFVFCDLTGALHAFQRDAHLSVASWLRHFFDGVPIPIAAREIHASVDCRRVALENLLHQADAFEEFAPVERRHQAKTADQVRHERLLSRLVTGI